TEKIELAGTAHIDNLNPLIGDELIATLYEGNATDIRYEWKADGETVGTASTYIVSVGDFGKAITVVITSGNEKGTKESEATAAVQKKAAPETPAMPTLAEVTRNSVTLEGIPGGVYSIDGESWQTSNEFTGLTANTSYTFYQRIAETDDTYASEVSEGLEVTTENALIGTATISNASPRIGDVLTASIADGDYIGTLSYVWRVDGSVVGTASSIYTVTILDFDKVITVTISSNAEIGELTSEATATVQKKVAPDAPLAPVLVSKTETSITLTAIIGYQYRMDDGAWQSSNMFSGLTAGTSYAFYQRIAATIDTEASAESDALNESTSGQVPILPQIVLGSINVQTAGNSIVLENLPQNAKVEVYNLQGKQIYSAHPENSQILRILVAKGMYIVNITSGSEKRAIRVSVM
ncbi:MAG: T9SS type A sorting domain-containing protein, partial [Fibromonadales bacterium]|nr:T9SS type A sorting domain-containing protein [Fibromonadales bacterium]